MVKQYLADELEESIQFCDSHRKNQSQFVFSSKLDIKDIVKILRSQDTMKDAAIKIRQAFLNMNFNLGDKFCHSEKLQNPCRNTNTLDAIVSFFAELFNMSKTHLLKDINSDEVDKPDETFDEYEFNQSSSSDEQKNPRLLKSIKIKSMLQILHYNIHSGRKLTPFHVMNSEQVHERCRSKELITSFNRSGLCISYQPTK